jgi:hypothetical protein
MKNTTLLYILTISIFEISSCSMGSGCEMNYPCTPINFGLYKPNDSTKYWLPQNIDSISITNSNGFNSKINYSLINENYQNEISYRTEPVSTPCGTSMNCSDYYYQNLIGWNYLINDLNTNIKVYRMPEMSVTNTLYYKPSTSEIYAKGDFMVVKIGYRTFTTDFSDCLFLNSILMNNVEYKNVYEKTFTNRYGDPIFVNKVYFNKGLGLIGYQLSNNELWNLSIK